MPVIASSDTVINPRAVMIKGLQTITLKINKWSIVDFIIIRLTSIQVLQTLQWEQRGGL